MSQPSAPAPNYAGASRTRPLLELNDIELVVTQPVHTTILHPTTVSFIPHQTVAIVGPSGAGKTTLASIIGGLQPASAGQYLFNQRDVTSMTPNEVAAFRSQSVGFVFQHAHLIDERSALENVTLGITDVTIPDIEIQERGEQALERVGLADIRHRTAALMSGGERQRVAIARAIVKEPQLLIADEPTGALDQKTGRIVLDLLSGLVELGVTVLIVTHDQRAAATAQRCLEVIDGRIANDTRTISSTPQP